VPRPNLRGRGEQRRNGALKKSPGYLHLEWPFFNESSIFFNNCVGHWPTGKFPGIPLGQSAPGEGRVVYTVACNVGKKNFFPFIIHIFYANCVVVGRGGGRIPPSPPLKYAFDVMPAAINFRPFDNRSQLATAATRRIWTTGVPRRGFSRRLDGYSHQTRLNFYRTKSGFRPRGGLR